MLSKILPVITLMSPGAIAFHLGNWPVRWYGIMVALGFLLSYFIAEQLIVKNKLSVIYFNDLIFFILISSVVFARLWFVLLSWDYFKDHLSEIPKIWYGGQSIHGGIFGAILATYLYSKVKKISFYSYIDVIAVVAPLGQAIGRWGNFFNNEAFGKPVINSLIRLKIPLEYRPEKYLTYETFHPTFLYESILNLIVFLFLYKKFGVWKNKPGKTFWSYLLSYSIIRFILEFVRVDSLYLFGNIASAHVISLIVIILSIYFLTKQ